MADWYVILNLESASATGTKNSCPGKETFLTGSLSFEVFETLDGDVLLQGSRVVVVVAVAVAGGGVELVDINWHCNESCAQSRALVQFKIYVCTSSNS